MNDKPLGYIGGDIMTHGSQLARQEECDKIEAEHLNVNYYSPAQNKSINDKTNMTEEQNNGLAEKITEADIDRLWNSDFAVMCAEQSAIGTMCEIGCLFGWKYMADKLLNMVNKIYEGNVTFSSALEECAIELISEISRIQNKLIFTHCADIRTNHLNEKDWRRSFSINQLLYGMILYCTSENKMHENFDSVLKELKTLYGEKTENE